jgi:hypothetical protein
MTAIRNFPNAPLARRRASQPLLAPLRDFGQALWLGLQRVGQRRAAHELEQLANHYALHDPVLARQLRAAAEECRRAAIAPLTRGARRTS